MSTIFFRCLPPSRAAKAATQAMPIVIATGVDPVELGPVAGLARRGGSITGVSYHALHCSDASNYRPRHCLDVALRLGAKSLLTTEKDFWNLKDMRFSALPVFVTIIDLEITGETEFLTAVNSALQTRGAQP